MMPTATAKLIMLVFSVTASRSLGAHPMASRCVSSTQLQCTTLEMSALRGRSLLTVMDTASFGSSKGHEGCISPIHLDWKTPAQNQADRLEHGTHCRGERHNMVKLTEAEVREIINLKGIETQHSLAARFGVAQPTIAHIHAGRTWSWLTA